MKISVELKKRFCKDCNIPINIFQEPYFTDRLKLYDKYYGTIEKYNIFIKELEKYTCEQDYFEAYNRVKDDAISSIKESEGYNRFNNENMNNYRIKNNNLPSKDIFKPSNDGKMFISIDMIKANFSSLQHYDNSMFADASTWEDFIGLFTDNKHIINSKYIRQVILGNCNPGRHITYEKYLMDQVLEDITKSMIDKNKIVFFSNDEIIFDITGNYSSIEEISDLINMYEKSQTYAVTNSKVPLKVELFTLHKIQNTDGYYKLAFKENGEDKVEFKCLDSLYLPFVIRYFQNEEVTESDKVFYSNGLLAKFIEVPKIGVT